MFGIDDLINFAIKKSAYGDVDNIINKQINQVGGIPLSAADSYQGTYTPEEFDPEEYGLPQDIAYRTAKDDPELRNRQLSALDTILKLSNDKITSASDFQRNRALVDAGNTAASRSAAIRSSADRQGFGGNALSMLLQQSAGQDAADRVGSLGLQSASDAAGERLAANNSYLQGTSNLRNQDFSIDAHNADIENRFNELNAERQRQVDQQNIDMRNRARSSAVDNRNQSQVYNINRQDQNARQKFSEEMQKQGMNNQLAGSKINARIGSAATDSGLVNGLTGSAVNLGTLGYLGASGMFSPPVYSGYSGAPAGIGSAATSGGVSGSARVGTSSGSQTVSPQDDDYWQRKLRIAGGY